ncbi:MAG: ABC transporter permease [Ferruginibacter sp.]
MIKNYLKIAVRNLVRHKGFSFINITGLAIGIASCLLLFTVLKYELSYDKFQPDYNKIFHVITEDKSDGEVNYTPGIPFPALEALRVDMPQVVTTPLMANYGSQVTVLGSNASNPSPGKKFIELTGFFFTDPEFFRVFHYDWLVGSPAVLKDPNVTVLTKKMAEKYFGDWKNATGQYLKLDNAITVKVAGILEDVPGNTDFPLAIVTSIETAKASNGVYFYSKDWSATTSNFQIFMLLPNELSEPQVNKQLLAFGKKNYMNNRTVRTNMLQPLSYLHFDKRVEIFGDHITERSTLWTLSLIAIFIIIMACINFINLSTAQAVGRSKEIGIRKVLGSYRRQLFNQVIGETAFIVIISVLLAIGIALICLPFIKHIAFISESLSLFNPQTFGFILILVIVVTLFAGLYPALILSGFKPALALKNKITSATVGGISIRRGLVVTQFAISQVLIVGTIVAVTQMKYIRDADLGFAKDALMIINSNTDSIAQSRQKYFAQKLIQMPGIQSVSFSSDVPSSANNWSTNFAYDHRPDEDFGLNIKYADENYFKTYGLKFLAGNGYSQSDTTLDVVVNETLIKKLGLKSANVAIGKEIRMGRQPWKTIVGVTKDFKTNSLKEDIKPIIIAERRQFYTVAGIKIKSSDFIKAKANIEAMWNETYPEYAFTSAFMDENIAEFYQQDQKLALLYQIFAGIAIFISCLGLYGLVSFMAVQRTKEIGVRKVLGASVGNIIYLFSREFTILIIVGSIIAIPVAYYMMNSWLQDFVFRIKLTPVFFIVAIATSIIIAWLAVGYKSIKAAVANPVKSIRTE